MIKKKSIIIFCDSNKEVGLGHYSRSISLKNIIKKKISGFNVLVIVITNSKQFFNKNFTILSYKNFCKRFQDLIISNKPSHIFFNFSSQLAKKNLNHFFKFLINRKIKLIAIDNLFKYEKYLDHIWIPNIYLNSKYRNKKKFSFGWDKLLISEKKRLIKKKNKSFLVITGGTDKYNLQKRLPNLLETILKPNTKVNWVVGPFAKKPIIKNSELKWRFIQNRRNLFKVYSDT